MPDYVFCECRSYTSYDLSDPASQPFEVWVEYDNSSGANAWVHLWVSSDGDRPAVQVPPGADRLPVTLAHMGGDTTGVTMRARLRDTSDPVEANGTTLDEEEEQVGIEFYGLGMGIRPELTFAPTCLVTPLGKLCHKRFPPKFAATFAAFVRILVHGKAPGTPPILRYDFPGLATGWVQVRGKWALEYSFLAPNPVVLGAGERPLATAVLMDTGWNVKDMAPIAL